MANRNRVIILLFIVGLAIRVLTIPAVGTSDIGQYVKWGKNTAEKGLSKSFDGVYFPIQYYSFALAHEIGASTHIPDGKIIKIFNLIFELGLLGLLVSLTRKYIEPWKILVFYWLNPFSMIIFEQGYIDPQFSFFVLLSLFVLAREAKTTWRTYLLAGVPLGIALLMKPQAVPIFIGLGTLLLIHFYFSYRSKTRPQGLVFIFIPPIILFILFSLYFGFTLKLDGHKTLAKISDIFQTRAHIPEPVSELAAKSAFLGLHYIHVPAIMPAINAQMPNTWYLVAKVLNKDNKPIYRVQDTKTFAGIKYRNIGLLLFLIAQTFIIWKISKSSRSFTEKVILTICVVPILVPFLTTSAHENHFYLGFILLGILGSMLYDKLILQLGYILGVISAVNITFLYIISGPISVKYDTSTARIPLILVATIVFFILLYCLVKRSYNASVSNLT